MSHLPNLLLLMLSLVSALADVVCGAYRSYQDTDYNQKAAPADAEATNKATLDPTALSNAKDHMAKLVAKADAGEITIGDAVNLAILEEMIRDPSCVSSRNMHTCTWMDARTYAQSH